jgi:hypothetical protein
MAPGVDPVPVERYDGTGPSWRYYPSAKLTFGLLIRGLLVSLPGVRAAENLGA